MAAREKHWSVTLDAIPDSESPATYSEHLPDPQKYFAWYCERARELIASGHLTHALTILHHLPPDISVGKALLEQVLSFEKCLECIKELMLRAVNADVDNAAKEVLGGTLRRFSFRDFERGGVSALLKLIDNGAIRHQLTMLLFKSGSYGDRLDEGLSLLPGCGKAQLEPFLALRLSSPQPKSLCGELEALRDDLPKLKRRINRLLNLIVMRRESMELDLASWNEINAYKEFAKNNYEIELENVCLSELEALQDKI